MNITKKDLKAAIRWFAASIEPSHGDKCEDCNYNRYALEVLTEALKQLEEA